jgi:archaellum biogenesis ATPase FlaH
MKLNSKDAIKKRNTMIMNELGIRTHSLSMLVGPGGTGKSLLAMYLCMVAASSSDLKGNWKKESKALYIDYELGEHDINNRLCQLKFSNSNLGDIDVLFPVNKLNTLQGWEEFQKETEGYHFVVIDSLTTCLRKENMDLNNQNSSEIFEKLKAFAKEKGIAVLVTHNTNKQNSASGSGSLTFSDRAEIVGNLKRVGSDISVTCTKANHRAFSPFSFNIKNEGKYLPEYDLDEGIRLSFSFAPIQKDIMKSRVKAFLETNKDVTNKSQIKPKGNAQKVTNTINEMIASGEIYQSEGVWKNK